MDFLTFRGEGIILSNPAAPPNITVSHPRGHELQCQVTQNMMPGSPDTGKVAAGWECNYVSKLVLQFKEHVWNTY